MTQKDFFPLSEFKVNWEFNKQRLSNLVIPEANLFLKSMGLREKLLFKSDIFLDVQFLDLRFRVEINNELTNNIIILLVGLLYKLGEENNNSHLDNNNKKIKMSSTLLFI